MSASKRRLRTRLKAIRIKAVLLTGISVAVLAGGTAWAIVGGTPDTGNGLCQPVPTTRGNLTTVLYNPTQTQLDTIEDVDADDCDIGIYFDGTRTAATTIDELHIHGANQYGVFVDGSGPPVAIQDSYVFGIGPNQELNGVQQGFGIWFQSAEGTVTRTQVGDYQKNGLVANLAGADVTVSDSDFRGKGPTTVIAQNGIQVSRGAVGSVIDNVIAEHDYTPKDTVAAGILIFQSDPRDVKRRLNTYDDNEFNEIVVP
jgi:Right handed beta helix region